MSGIDEYQHQLREGGDEIAGSLETIAAALGGEFDGRRFIRCPSVGKTSDDRSVCVIVRPNDFYIYDCPAGSRTGNEMAIREKLKLAPPLLSKNNSFDAIRVWDECLPAVDTVVEKYLRARRITLLPDCLRYHPSLYHGILKSKWPGMVALVTSSNGGAAAIHRTWLDPGGRKASIDPDRMSLGPCEGYAIHLAPAAEHILVGEGIETCLSAMQETGVGAWSAISANGIRELILPSIVRRVTILADGDDQGEGAALFACLKWQRLGLDARILRAPWGHDFNDVLMGRFIR